MSRIKGRDTKPEVVVRKYLYSRGFRYRVNTKIYGKPDLVFTNKKIAVFVHGCFWHQHGCSDTYRPKTNKKFWNNKLDQNIKRDKKVKKKLKEEGWETIYIWECEIKNSLPKAVKPLITVLKI